MEEKLNYRNSTEAFSKAICTEKRTYFLNVKYDEKNHMNNYRK